MATLQSRLRRETVAALLEPLAVLIGLWGYIIAGAVGPAVAFLLFAAAAALQAYTLRCVLINLGPPLLAGAIFAAASAVPIVVGERFLLGFLALKSVWLAVVYFLSFQEVARTMHESGELEQIHRSMSRGERP